MEISAAFKGSYPGRENSLEEPRVSGSEAPLGRGFLCREWLAWLCPDLGNRGSGRALCTQELPEGSRMREGRGGRTWLVLVPVPLSSDPPCCLDLDGSREEGWREEEGPFCHQRGSDQRIHHQHSQAHPWSVSIPAVAQGFAFGAPELNASGGHSGLFSRLKARWSRNQTHFFYKRSDLTSGPYLRFMGFYV